MSKIENITEQPQTEGYVDNETLHQSLFINPSPVKSLAVMSQSIQLSSNTRKAAALQQLASRAG